MASLPVVAIVGGGGYLGAVLLRMLLEQEYPVRVFDSFEFGYSGVENINSPLLKIVEGNICDTLAVSKFLDGADSVVLLASIIGHRCKEIERDNTREVNFLASSVVLDSAIEHGVKRFIFASSDSVYGRQEGIMYETSLPNPVSLFSRLKLRMEERIIKSKSRYFHPTALRIATCHGTSPCMRFDLLPNTLIRDAVTKHSITIDNSSLCRAFVHVQDAARVFMSCLTAHENLISGEVFNVVTDESLITVNQLANIASFLVPETHITVHETEPDLINYRLSSSKIKKVLDFTPQLTLEKSMEQVRDSLLEKQFEDSYNRKYQRD